MTNITGHGALGRLAAGRSGSYWFVAAGRMWKLVVTFSALSSERWLQSQREVKPHLPVVVR